MNDNMNDQVDPVLSTEIQGLLWLSAASIPEAVELNNVLGLNKTKIKNKTPGYERQLKVNTISTGIRYEALIDAAERSGCKNIFDLTSGFYPTFLRLYRNNFSYRGCDKPLVVQKMQPFVTQYTNGRTKLCSVDVTNDASMIKSAQDLDGSLCIINMSLLMYLQKYERESMLKSISALLKEHGGCWITPDPEAIPVYLDIAPIVMGIDLQKLIEAARKLYKDSPNAIIDQTYNGTPDEQEKFFRSFGFDVDKVPILPDDRRFDALYTLGSQKASEIRNKIKDKSIWIMRPSNNDNAPTVLKAGDFECSRDAEGRQLILNMSGRLDSLSSSDFQTYYDKLGGLGFNSIRLDMNRLTYISSTGLRVIMHMVKDVGQGNVSATGISDNVMDILNVTGFNTLLKM